MLIFFSEKRGPEIQCQSCFFLFGEQALREAIYKLSGLYSDLEVSCSM